MTSRRPIITTLFATLLFCVLTVAVPASAQAEDSDSPDSSTSDEASRPDDREWRYDTYYIFPLTRHMPDSELPLGGQIALYPFAFVIDLVQWPFGVLVGLGGE
jgi:hypothetical protein